MKLFRNPSSAALILSVLAIVVGTSFFQDSACQLLVCRGDFPAFYSAAKLAFSEHLYSPNAQLKIEQLGWPSLKDQYLYFAYPPYTAILYSPLANLTPLAAKLLMIALSILALIGVAYLSNSKESSLLILLVLIALPQNFIAVLSGQNLAFSMLFAAIIVFSKNEKYRGIASGLWWFKPQFAVFSTIKFLISRNWTAVSWSLIPIGLYFILGVVSQGLNWPSEWLSALAFFAEPEYAINSNRTINIFSVVSSIAGKTIALTLSLVVFIHFAWHSYSKNNSQSIALLMLVVLLLSPRTMFYDIGICLPAFFILKAKSLKIFAFFYIGACFAAVFAPPIEPIILCLLLLACYFIVSLIPNNSEQSL